MSFKQYFVVSAHAWLARSGGVDGSTVIGLIHVQASAPFQIGNALLVKCGEGVEERIGC